MTDMPFDPDDPRHAAFGVWGETANAFHSEARRAALVVALWVPVVATWVFGALLGVAYGAMYWPSNGWRALYLALALFGALGVGRNLGLRERKSGAELRDDAGRTRWRPLTVVGVLAYSAAASVWWWAALPELWSYAAPAALGAVTVLLLLMRRSLGMAVRLALFLRRGAPGEG